MDYKEPLNHTSTAHTGKLLKKKKFNKHLKIQICFNSFFDSLESTTQVVRTKKQKSKKESKVHTLNTVLYLKMQNNLPASTCNRSKCFKTTKKSPSR